jgi:large subunit ribosomal protein L18
MYAQVINDEIGHTIVSASDLEEENRNLRRRVEDAEKLGEVLGKRLKEYQIESVVFDRNGYPYHGVVKAIAEGTRKAGIKF